MHNPYTDVEFDPVKARANLNKHKVNFAQAEAALNDPMAVTIQDNDSLRKSHPADFCAQGKQRRSGAIPCVRNMISARESAAPLSLQPEKRALPSCSTTTSSNIFENWPKHKVQAIKP